MQPTGNYERCKAMATELLKIKRYEFSDGTTLHVRIDFENNQVALVNKEGMEQSNKFGKSTKYEPTKFLFAGREVQYMNGWINILAAMQYAIKDARDELLAWQKVQENKKTKQIIDIMIALNDKKDD